MAVWIVHFKKKKKWQVEKTSQNPRQDTMGAWTHVVASAGPKRGDLRTATRQIQKELVNNSCRRREEAIQVASGILVGWLSDSCAMTLYTQEEKETGLMEDNMYNLDQSCLLQQSGETILEGRDLSLSTVQTGRGRSSENPVQGRQLMHPCPSRKPFRVTVRPQ